METNVQDGKHDVTIVVKNVYAPTETKEFQVEATITVRELKQRIHMDFPSNPHVHDQKLIFGGKICEDNDPIEKILTQNQVSTNAEDATEEKATVVFHLLVTSALPKGIPTRSTPVAKPKTPPNTPRDRFSRLDGTARPGTPTHTAAAAPPVTPPAAAPSPFHFQSPFITGNPGLQSFFGATMPSPTSSAHPQPSMPSAAHGFLAQHMLMQQQAMILMQIQYLQQLKVYHESLAAHQRGTTHESSSGSATPSTSAPPQQPHPHHQAAHAAAAPPLFGMPHPGLFHAPGPAAAAPGVPPAAAARAPQPQQQPGLVRQVVLEVGPLFDLRLAVKMAFMLFIFGQDTPYDRLILLCLLATVAYLHLTGIFAKIYEIYKRSSAPATPAPVANNDADNNQQAPAAAPTGLTSMLRISSDRGFVQDMKYFFIGFVLSLAPVWHPQPLTDPVRPVERRPEPENGAGAAAFPLQGI